MPNTVQGKASGVYATGYLQGGPELAAKLQALEKSVRDNLLVDAVTAGAEVVAEEWRLRVRSTFGLGPGTAHYANAIGVDGRPSDVGATAWVGVFIDQPTEEGEAQPWVYATRLEFGHHLGGIEQPPRPTLRPAYEATRVKSVNAIAAKIRDLIKKVAPLTGGG